MRPQISILPGAVSTLLLVSSALAQTHSWSIVRVDSTSNGGAYCSLALDDQANPRIAYLAFGQDLKYASNTLGSWTFQYPIFVFPNYISLELAANGEPRVSFFANSDGTLRFGERNSGSWTFTTVDANPFSAGLFSSQKLDGQGNPRIAYHNEGGAGFVLRYAERNAGVWTIETPDAVGATGYQTSLALDQDANPRISYYSLTAGALKFAAKNAGVWSTEIVDMTGPPNTNAFPDRLTSIALDSQGNPHIAYYDNLHGKLRYASRADGAWTPTTVDSAGNVGGYISLQLDAMDRPRISYYDITNQDLKFAHQTGGTWTIELVDSAGDVGRWSSLRLDAQGDPHISYEDASRGSLNLAHGTPAQVSVGTAPVPAMQLACMPNPVSGDLQVRFALSHGGPAVVELIDLLGRRLASRQAGASGQGRQQLTLGTGTLAPGLYFVRLTQGLATMTTRVIVVR